MQSDKDKRMQEENPLLSDFLEELKKLNDGVFLDKTISIFYNDWSLNPYEEDDYSERVDIETAKLRDIDTTKFKSYKVLDSYQNTFDPNFVEICVEENLK